MCICAGSVCFVHMPAYASVWYDMMPRVTANVVVCVIACLHIKGHARKAYAQTCAWAHMPADCIRALASTSNEAAADLDQPLERLRCLQLLEDVWHTTWTLRPAYAATSSPSQMVAVDAGAAAAALDATPLQQLLQVLLQGEGCQGQQGVQQGTNPVMECLLGNAAGNEDEGSCAGGGILDALRCTALRVARRQGMLARALGAAVSTCQSKRQGTKGAMYAQQLRELLISFSHHSGYLHARATPTIAPPPSGVIRGAARPGHAEGLETWGGANMADLAQLALVLRPDAGVFVCVRESQ